MKTIIAILVLATSVGVAETMTNSTLRLDLSSSDFETRRRAAIELHKLGDNSGVPAMIEAMGTLTNQSERNNAVVALRVTKDPRSIPTLTRATSDPSAYVRSIALAALGELAATNAYDVIVSHVTDLANFGGDVPTYPGESACYALGALGDKRAIPVLMKALDQRETQCEACHALEKLTGQAFRYDVEKWKAWWKEHEIAPNQSLDLTVKTSVDPVNVLRTAGQA